MKLRTRMACACILAVMAATLVAAQAPAWAPKVDAVFARWDSRESPGCAVGVFRDGRIVYERGYGMADLEHDIPITPETVFYVGSVSKQFTAMAAALAIRDGRLRLEDPIRKHLPELPSYADAITVRHLIHHTSGLRDYNTLLSMAGRRGDEAYDNLIVLRLTARQKALNFTPGSEYLYSNTGYTLLATIVERAVGKPFAEYADAMIFKPLGMSVSHFHTDNGRIVKGRAYAYAAAPGGGFHLDTPSNERAGAGGVFTNVRDMQKWDENFYDAKVGGRALIDQMQVVGALNDGKPLNYAWGLQIGTYRGQRAVEHSGSLNAYRAHILRLPGLHVSVTALCNNAVSPGAALRDVVDAVLGGELTEPRASASAPPSLDPPAPDSSRTPSAMTPSAASFPGDYYSDEIDATFTIAKKDDGLTLRRDSDREAVTLQHVADGTFRARGLTIRFEPASLVVDAGRVRGIRFIKR